MINFGFQRWTLPTDVPEDRVPPKCCRRVSAASCMSRQGLRKIANRKESSRLCMDRVEKYSRNYKGVQNYGSLLGIFGLQGGQISI